MQKFDYGRMMQRAMQGLMAEALGHVAFHGLPGEHHFYITFLTQHPGVELPDTLRERYPDEMVIVLQHDFTELAVTQDRFSVKLSFSGRPAKLVIPFDAVLQFADPSAAFGLRFDPTDPDETVDDEDDSDEQRQAEARARRGPAPTSLAELSRKAPAEPGPATAKPGSGATGGGSGGGASGGDGSGEIVSLDKFRKK